MNYLPLMILSNVKALLILVAMYHSKKGVSYAEFLVKKKLLNSNSLKYELKENK